MSEKRGLDDVTLTTRSYLALKREGIRTIDELSHRTAAQILRIPNIGRKSLREMEELLAEHGLKFGMHPRGWGSDLEFHQQYSARFGDA